MQQPQLFFSKTQKTTQEIKELKAIFKEALANSQEYQNLTEEIKTLRARKKSVEDSIKDDFTSELDRLDTLKLDLDNDKMLLSDSALHQLIDGKSISVKDDRGIEYEPVFSVKFKKIK